MLEGITPLHLVIVLVVLVLVLGPGRLPEVGAAIGKSIRAFRAASGDEADSSAAVPVAASPAGASTPEPPELPTDQPRSS